ncbi:MAG: hypothetical protein P4L16_04725 [Chlamydiales bacterium]|nr:hypothetical protein [Chlamydiales bacterium]
MTRAHIQKLVIEFHELVGLTRQFIQQENPLLFIKDDGVDLDHSKLTKKVQEQSIKSEILEEVVKLTIPLPEKERPSPPILEVKKVVEEPGVYPSFLDPMSSKIVLEPIISALEDPLNDIKKAVKLQFPNILFLDSTLDDQEAVLIKTGWKSEPKISQIVFLLHKEQDKQASFLLNIAKAISYYEASVSALVIEKIEKREGVEKFLQSPILKLIVASSNLIYSYPSIMKHYKESNKVGEHFLGNIPLILLTELTSCFKDSSLKMALWKKLTLQLKNLGFGRE